MKGLPALNKFSYNGSTYYFREIFESLFDEPLEQLSYGHDDVVTAHTDQDSPNHKKYYDNIGDTGFFELYKEFVREEIANKYFPNEPLLYQKIPTFRIHPPGNLGVGEFHRDSKYSHSVHEWNIFLPITDAFHTNTIWTESTPYAEDFRPMPVTHRITETVLGTKYLESEAYLWKGSTLKHGNKVNEESQTRVSVDFRVLPAKYHSEQEVKSSITNKTPMSLGHYWLMLD